MVAVKVITSTTGFRDLFYRDRDFIGTSGIVYKYRDQFLSGSIRSFSNSRTTHERAKSTYRALIRAHKNATTLLDGDKYVVEFAPCAWDASWHAYDGVQRRYRDQYDRGRGWPRSILLPPTPVTSDNPDAALQAKYRLYKVLRDKRQAWEGMVFLGELRELIHMVRNPAQSLRRGLGDWVRDAAKHRPHKRSVSHVNRALAGSWLEWTYGMAPTISDLNNAKEALNRHLDRYEELYQKFYSQSDPIRSAPTNWVAHNYQLYPWMFSQRHRTYLQSRTIYYGQVYTAAASSRGFTRQQLGFELRNFVPTVWELIPYSFVADYFTNIGDVLTAASTHTGDVAWISQTNVNEGVAEHVPTGISLYSNVNAQQGTVSKLRVVTSLTGRLVIKRRRVFRTALLQVPGVNPIKDFRLELPGAGSTKWVNLLALFSASRSTERLLRGSRS